MSAYADGNEPRIGDVVTYGRGVVEWTLTLKTGRWFYVTNAAETQERCFRYDEWSRFRLIRRADAPTTKGPSE